MKKKIQQIPGQSSLKQYFKTQVQTPQMGKTQINQSNDLKSKQAGENQDKQKQKDLSSENQNSFNYIDNQQIIYEESKNSIETMVENPLICKIQNNLKDSRCHKDAIESNDKKNIKQNNQGNSSNKKKNIKEDSSFVAKPITKKVIHNDLFQEEGQDKEVNSSKKQVSNKYDRKNEGYTKKSKNNQSNKDPQLEQDTDKSTQFNDIRESEKENKVHKEKCIPHEKINSQFLESKQNFKGIKMNKQLNCGINNEMKANEWLDDSNKQIQLQVDINQQNSQYKKSSQQIPSFQSAEKKQKKDLNLKQEHDKESYSDKKKIDLTKQYQNNDQKILIQNTDNIIQNINDDQNQKIAVQKKNQPIKTQEYKLKQQEQGQTEKQNKLNQKLDEIENRLTQMYQSINEMKQLISFQNLNLTAEINQKSKQNSQSIIYSVQNNLQEATEAQEQNSMEIEMKGKDDYRIIQYKNTRGENIKLIPSEEQLDIIVSDIKKDTKIIACAGSGKTTTLILRIKYLLDHCIEPKQIIISTFTVEAGKNIIQKLYQLIGEISQQQIIIGNIDKIAYQFIKNELETMKKNSNKVSVVCQKQYCQIWLNDIKNNKNKYKQYKYFLFDEFQDVSEKQYEILMEFKKLGSILTVIGDDAQSIYNYRDAKIDIIQRRINEDLKKMKKDLQEFTLTTNYRSTNEITLFTKEILQKDDSLIKREMKCAQKRDKADKLNNQMEQFDKYVPQLNVVDSQEIQNQDIIKRILNLVQNKSVQFKDIAIIGPINAHLKAIEEEIEKYNQQKSDQSDKIPYYAHITENIFAYKQMDYYEQHQRQNKVTISTIHKSKGLEWDYVYFIGCNDDSFPMFFVEKNKNYPQKTLDELRRVFYVGSTRAIKRLDFYCIVKGAKKNTCKQKVTRFFADIPQKLFNSNLALDQNKHLITDYKQIQSEQKSKIHQNNKVKQNIKEVISKMTIQQHEDIGQYCQNIVYEDIEQLYKKHEITQSVKDDQLFSDMCMFFDKYIIRKIGEKYEAENSFYDEVATKVILPTISKLNLNESQLLIFLTYNDFIANFKQEDFKNHILFIEKFQSEYKIESKNVISNMKQLHQILTSKNNLKQQLFNQMKNKQYQYFKDNSESLKKSKVALSEYMNKSKQSEDIFESIYLISKCSFLYYEDRRKCLFNNNLEKILDHDLISNINEDFINVFLSQFKKINCKMLYQTDNIEGLIDIIGDQNHLIFFKFQSFKEYNGEDLLNYLFSAAFQLTNSQNRVEYITEFNVLNGTKQTFDLREWNQQQQFIDKIELIAKANANANILLDKENNILNIIDEYQDIPLNRDQQDQTKRNLIPNIAAKLEISDEIQSKDSQIIVNNQKNKEHKNSQEILKPDQIKYKNEKSQREKNMSSIKFKNQHQIKSQLNSPIQYQENKNIEQQFQNEQSSEDINSDLITEEEIKILQVVAPTKRQDFQENIKQQSDKIDETNNQIKKFRILNDKQTFNSNL